MKRVAAFAPAAIWALFILWVGSIPSLAIPGGLPLDKVGHFGAFAVLGALLALGLHLAGTRTSIAWPLAAGILVGVIDELHQRGVVGRTADWKDLIADAAGCAVALWLTRTVLDRRAARRDDARASHPVQEHRA